MTKSFGEFSGIAFLFRVARTSILVGRIEFFVSERSTAWSGPQFHRKFLCAQHKRAGNLCRPRDLVIRTDNSGVSTILRRQPLDHLVSPLSSF